MSPVLRSSELLQEALELRGSVSSPDAPGDANLGSAESFAPTAPQHRNRYNPYLPRARQFAFPAPRISRADRFGFAQGATTPNAISASLVSACTVRTNQLAVGEGSTFKGATAFDGLAAFDSSAYFYDRVTFTKQILVSPSDEIDVEVVNFPSNAITARAAYSTPCGAVIEVTFNQNPNTLRDEDLRNLQLSLSIPNVALVCCSYGVFASGLVKEGALGPCSAWESTNPPNTVQVEIPVLKAPSWPSNKVFYVNLWYVCAP